MAVVKLRTSPPVLRGAAFNMRAFGVPRRVGSKFIRVKRANMAASKVLDGSRDVLARLPKATNNTYGYTRLVPCTPKWRRLQGTTNHCNKRATTVVSPSTMPRKAVKAAPLGKAARKMVLYSKSINCRAIIVVRVVRAIVINSAEART